MKYHTYIYVEQLHKLLEEKKKQHYIGHDGELWDKVEEVLSAIIDDMDNIRRLPYELGGINL